MGSALNTLEIIILSTPRDENGVINIDKSIIEDALQKPVVNYDSTGIIIMMYLLLLKV